CRVGCGGVYSWYQSSRPLSAAQDVDSIRAQAYPRGCLFSREQEARAVRRPRFQASRCRENFSCLARELPVGAGLDWAFCWVFCRWRSRGPALSKETTKPEETGPTSKL